MRFGIDNIPPTSTFLHPALARLLGTRCLGALLLIASVAVLSGCKSDTLFRSNFDSTPVGNFPAATQAVGTAAIDGPPGSVVIVTVPGAPGDPVLPGHWVRITRANAGAGTPVSGLKGNFSKFGGEGDYTFTTTLHIPAGSDTATIQCEPFGQPTGTLTNFLHVDFTDQGQVRVDDDGMKIVGTFTHGLPFIVQLRLKIGPSAGTVNVALGGDGASGEATFPLQPALYNLARQFGAVRVWMGFPHVGSVHATNIVVKRDTD